MADGKSACALGGSDGLSDCGLDVCKSWFFCCWNMGIVLIFDDNSGE